MPQHLAALAFLVLLFIGAPGQAESIKIPLVNKVASWPGTCLSVGKVRPAYCISMASR